MIDLSDAWDARKVLDALDDAACEILRRHHIDSWPRMMPVPEHIQAVTGYPTYPVWSMPAGTPEQAQGAGRLLEAVRIVRGFLHSNGTLNDAIILGIRLGIAAEQAGLADLIPLAKKPVKLEQRPSDRPSESIQELPAHTPRQRFFPE